jgi:hypothetical protein
MLNFALYTLAARKIGGSRLHGALRVTAYATGLTLVLGAVGAHKARAALGEKGLEFGEDVASFSSMMKDAHTFRLNGQTIHTNSATTLEGVTTVLDRYEGICKSATGGDTPVWTTLPVMTDEPPKKPAKLSTMPILRQQVGEKGMIACFVPRDSSGQHSQRAFSEALKEFKETGNFSAIGMFRYAYVRGSNTGSMVITVSTDANFNVKALMPEAGKDTQGSDPSVMIRPDHADRLFTGTIDGLPYKVYAYRTHDSVSQVIGDYDAKMEKAGWLSVNNPIFEGGPHEGNDGHAYINGDKGFAGVVSAMGGANGDTMVGIAEVTDGKIQAPTSLPKDADGF